MIDNIQKIIPFLVFQDSSFYSISVGILDKKTYNFKLLKHYMIDSLQQLLSNYDEIKFLSDSFNATAYIKLSSFSKERLGYKLLNSISNKFEEKDLDFSNLIVTSIKNLKPNNEFWVVSVDFGEATYKDVLRIKTVIDDCPPNSKNVLEVIPIPNGLHIITKPFNTHYFITKQDVYYKCSIMKYGSETILYSNLNQQ